ncbi:hypothetical protein JX265_010153 [Neoarthrinium moseri]|uniref:non-chaperonin molecular chaperone ATPase n=1 Tax=Neoarthrinium moseri TaxID=1658444 RepID=A0A9P9WFC3_9PEZI|nr:hypothetical protein JX265_010153 [Neoarthrinium moseri]
MADWRSGSRRNALALFLGVSAILGIFILLLTSSTASTGGGYGQDEYGVVIGIDIGNTNARVAFINQEQQHHIVRHGSGAGKSHIDSCVAFTDNEILIGEEAREHMMHNPVNTICGVRDLIGSRWSDPMVQALVNRVPYRIIEHNDKPVLQVVRKGATQEFTPEDIYSMVLGRLKSAAEDALGFSVTHAVVAVPTYFGDNQRQAVKDAAVKVGLNALRLVNEPTSAGIAHSVDHNDESLVLVVDVGGTSTDITLSEVDQGVFEIFATDHIAMGGTDLDERVISSLLLNFRRANDIEDSVSGSQALDRLRSGIQQAKHELSTFESAQIEMDSFYENIDFNETLTRARFEELNTRFIHQLLIKATKNVLSDAKVSKDQVTDILLVGGSTKIPAIRNSIETFFDGKKLATRDDPDEAVVIGAAIQGSVLSGDDGASNCGLYIDLSPLSIGIETFGGAMNKIIPRWAPIPMPLAPVENNGSVRLTTMQQLERRPGLFSLVLPTPRVAELQLTYALQNDTAYRRSGSVHYHGYGSDDYWVDHVEPLMESEVDYELADQVQSRIALENYILALERRFQADQEIPASCPADALETLRTVVEDERKWLGRFEIEDGVFLGLTERLDGLRKAGEQCFGVLNDRFLPRVGNRTRPLLDGGSEGHQRASQRDEL